MKKKICRYVLLFLFFFIVTFLYNFFLLNSNCDEIWNYGFSCNIANGLIPYKDFNMVVTPLFSFIGVLFIKIFGNHIYAYDIYIAVIVSIISILCYKKFGKNALILFFIFVPHLVPSYNALSFLYGKGIYDGVLADSSNYDKSVMELKKYILSLGDDYDNLFIYSVYSSELSYTCKLDLGYKINKFDLISNGNIGHNGEEKYLYELDDICSKESCLFFIDNFTTFSFTQTNRNIYNYAKSNYNKLFDIKSDNLDFTVYSNK